MASTTKTNPYTKTSKGLSKINEDEAIIAPKNKDPVSPINALAGCKLKNKKPIAAPTITAETTVREMLSCLVKETKNKNKPTVNETLDANPSMPSVKLTLFTIPHKIK